MFLLIKVYDFRTEKENVKNAVSRDNLDEKLMCSVLTLICVYYEKVMHK